MTAIAIGFLAVAVFSAGWMIADAITGLREE
jgi:hypothetical protein